MKTRFSKPFGKKAKPVTMRDELARDRAELSEMEYLEVEWAGPVAAAEKRAERANGKGA